MKALAVAITLALAAPASFCADDAFRSVMPDGSVHYGATPEPGARKVQKIAPPPLSTGTMLVTPDEKQAAARPMAQSGVSGVLPPANRKSPQPATAGALQTPGTLPTRGGYE
jgi:hypothetical protein